MIKKVINVQAPRDLVYQVLTDYEKYQAWLPGCKSAKVTARNGDTVDTEIVIASMKTMTMALRFRSDGGSGLTFDLIKSSDLKGYSGSYRLMDAADGVGTVVITEMELDAGAMVPKFMVNKMATKSVDDTGVALCEYVKKVPVAAGPAKPAGAGAKPAARPAQPQAPRRKRARRVISVSKSQAGYRVWYLGREFEIKD
jgi:hypothetical protein